MTNSESTAGGFGIKGYWINVASSYLPFLIQIFGGLFLTPLFIGKLGQECYGLFVLINTIIGYFSLCDIGFSRAFTYRVIAYLQEDKQDKIDSLISSVFYYYLVVGILINVVVATGCYFNFGISRFEDTMYRLFKAGMVTLSLSFLTILISQIFDRLLFAKNRIYIINIVKTIQQLTIIVSNIIVLVLSGELTSIFLNYFAVNFLTLIVLFFISKKECNYHIRMTSVSIRAFSSISKDGWWFFVGILNYLLIFQTDVFVITTLFDLKAVALYTIYYKFINLFNVMLTKPVESLIPTITQSFNGQNYPLVLRYHRYMLALTATAAPVIAVALLSPGYRFLQWWMGESVVNDYGLFIPFVIYFVLSGIDNVSSTFLSAMCLHRNSVVMGLFNGVLNLFFSVYLGRYMGLKGVIFGSIFALLVSSFLYNLYYFNLCIKPKKECVQ